MRDFSKEMHDFMDNNQCEISSEFFMYRTAIMYAIIDLKTLNGILNLDPVYRVELAKTTSIETIRQSELSLNDISDFVFERPDRNAQPVCILDTGVMINHPALEHVIIKEKKFGLADDITDSDEDGHGTENAGFIVYGNIQQCIKNRSFIPRCKLCSAKISRSSNITNIKKLLGPIEQAIQFFYKSPYICRIFYLSFLDGPGLMNDTHPKDHALSNVLDEITYQYNICIICPAGNSSAFYERNEHMPMRADLYPQILFKENGILDGASGCSVLTVGSFAGKDSNLPGEARFGDRARFLIPANKDDLSPFSVVGPGFNDSIKPELLASGGNLAFDANTHKISTLSSLSFLSLNFDFIKESIFLNTQGTCVSAAKATYMIARLAQRYPGYTGNLYKALAVNLSDSNDFTQLFETRINSEIKNKLFKYTGYGRLKLITNLLYGNASKITLFNEDTIPYKEVHYYKIPVPESFKHESGDRIITVTLSYNPPIRPYRHDYQAVKLRFYLIRPPKGLDDLRKKFGNFKDESDDAYHDFQNADIKILDRSRGTIQSSKYTIKIIRRINRSDNYYVVIQCTPKEWYQIPPDENGQPYAIVVSIEHVGNNRLYDQVQLSLRQLVRV